MTNPQHSTYRALVQNMWTDGKIIPEEVTTLTTMQSQLGITPEDAAGIERDVMGQTKEEALVAGMGTNIPPAPGSNVGHTPPRGAHATPARTPIEGTLSGGQTLASSGQGLAATEAGGLQPGDIINDRFEVLELLGEGGMGQILKVRDQDLDDIRAMKVVKRELIERDDIHERFRNEVKLCQKLNHGHIVRVYDYGRDRGRGLVYFTMEFVEGQTLRQWMVDRATRRQVVSLEEFQKIAKGLCEALIYAHATTIHRDLKPENIMVSDDASSIKLMDFGIAKMLDGPTQYNTAQNLGTAYYIAPEQERGDDIDHRADIYAAGILLYELLTGRPPRGRFKTPRELRDDVPESLSEAILTAMNTERDERPKDAAALLGTLERAHTLDASMEVPYPRPGFTDADFAKLKRLAEEGNSRAMGVLGMSLVDGVCCNIEVKAGTRWLAIAAKKGDLLGLVYRAMAHASIERRMSFGGHDWVLWDPPLPQSNANANNDWLQVKQLIEHARRASVPDPIALFAEWLYEGYSPLASADHSRIEHLLSCSSNEELLPAMRDLARLYSPGPALFPGHNATLFSGKCDIVRTLLQRAAESGDAVAMYWLAVNLANRAEGPEGPRDYLELADAWLRKANAVGARAARWLLRNTYSNSGEHKRVVELDRQDAECGDVHAMNQLGDAYTKGEGVPRDSRAAAEWYQRSADAGNEWGLFYLACCYKDGLGVQKDDAKAIQLCRRSAQLSCHEAMVMLGDAYYDGCGLARDYCEAACWYEKALELIDDPWAEFGLAKCYEYGHGVTKDAEKAIKLYEKAADAGIAEAKGALKRLGNR